MLESTARVPLRQVLRYAGIYRSLYVLDDKENRARNTSENRLIAGRLV
jgi:hypothetical protein